MWSSSNPHFKVFAASSLILFLSPFLARAQRSLPEARFALEVADVRDQRPHFSLLYEPAGELLFQGSSLQGVGHATAADKPAPSVLKVRYRVDGEVVVMTVSLLFGAIDPQATPTSTQNLPEQKVGRYSAHLGDTVAFNEMEGVGLQPITVKLVSSQPPPFPRPEVVSKAPSLCVEITGEDRLNYKLAVRNSSAHFVTAVLLDQLKDGNGGGHQHGDGSRPVILPGGTLVMEFNRWASGRVTSSGWVVDTVAPPIILEAALFDNDAYEGDVDSAAVLIAGKLAREFQRRRVRNLVDGIMADNTGDDVATAKRIRSEVTALSDDPDAAIADQVRSRFKGLSQQTWNNINANVRSMLSGGKNTFLFELQEFEARRGGRSRSLTDWWGSRRSFY